MWSQSAFLVFAVRILVLKLFSTIVTAQTNSTDSILFFYSPLQDACEWGLNNSFQATNNTVNGGLCAYIPATDRLYACPAPNPQCWTFNQNCKYGIDTPGPDQILCGEFNAYQWCCASYEMCTPLSGYINICDSTWDSPNSGVQPTDAVSIEYSARPSRSIGTITPNSTPSVFSTMMWSISTNTGMRLETSVETSVVTSTGTGTRTATRAGTSTEIAAATSSATTETPTTGNTGLTEAAIVGIAVSTVAAVTVIVGMIIFLVWRKRERYSRPNQDDMVKPEPSELPTSPKMTPAHELPS
ncbi:hypothetical protein V8E54_007386 [Elaphomyces granulatus]